MTVESDGELHVLERGGGSGSAADSDLPPPVLLLHGFTGSSRAWESPILDRLSTDRRVLAVDLPGHGSSGLPDPAGGIERVVERLDATLDRHDVERADWVGYSMGGRMALAAAVLAPGRIRRLVLEGASPGLETPAEREERRRADDFLARQIEERGNHWFVDHWMALPFFASQRALPHSRRDRARSQRLSQSPEGLAAALRTMGTGSQPSFWPHLERVTVPTLLLTGGEDPKYQLIAERMRARMPHAVHRSVRGAGHAVHFEAPEPWLQVVTGFLGPGEAHPEEVRQG